MSHGRIAFTDKVEFQQALRWRELGAAEIAAHKRVIVDFSAMTGYNSVLLAVLLGYKRLAQAKQCELEWQAVPESLLTLASVYNVKTVLGM